MENKTANNYNECLKLFVGKDEFREWMNHPFKIEQLAIATDAYTAIIVPLEKTQNISNLLDGHLSIDAIKNALTKPFKTELKTLTVDQLKHAFKQTPLIDEVITNESSIQCDDCCGSGNVTWEYGRHEKEDDCPICDGDGEIDTTTTTKTGNKIPDKNTFVSFGQVVSKLEFVERIINVCELLNHQTIEIICLAPKDRIVLKVIDAEITIKHNATEDKPIYHFNV